MKTIDTLSFGVTVLQWHPHCAHCPAPRQLCAVLGSRPVRTRETGKRGYSVALFPRGGLALPSWLQCANQERGAGVQSRWKRFGRARWLSLLTSCRGTRDSCALREWQPLHGGSWRKRREEPLPWGLGPRSGGAAAARELARRSFPSCPLGGAAGQGSGCCFLLVWCLGGSCGPVPASEPQAESPRVSF